MSIQPSILSVQLATLQIGFEHSSNPFVIQRREVTASRDLSLAARSTSSMALVADSNALVPSVENIARIALERLKALKEQMGQALSEIDSQAALESLRQYEIQYQKSCEIIMTGLGKSSFLESYRERLLDTSIQLETACRGLKERLELKRALKQDFNKQLDIVNRDFPQELQGYLTQTIQEVRTLLNMKGKAFDQQVTVYEKRMQTLQKFLEASTSSVPAYSIYGTDLKKIADLKKEFIETHAKCVQEIRNLSQPGNLLDQVKEKIKVTVQRLEHNKKVALEALENKFAHVNPIGAEENAEAFLKAVNDFYLQQLNEYLSSVSNTLNQLIGEMQETIALSLRIQDENMLVLSKKAQVVLDVLKHEADKILEVAEAMQKPMLSQEIGRQLGTAFDESASIAHGRISQISVRSGWWLDALQVTYTDHHGVPHTGSQHGKNGGNLSEIRLDSNEKITKVVIGTGAFSYRHEPLGVEEITFYVRKDQLASPRSDLKYGPYGRSGCLAAMEDLKNHHGGKLRSVLKTQEISFGENYYLGAIKGKENAYITSLTFVFFKDFSSVLKKDLTDRIEAAIRIIKENPELLSESEKKRIQATFADKVYIDLTVQNPYAILGLQPKAELEEVKKTYKELALKHHPDKGGDEAKFNEIKTAYDKIINERGGAA